MMAECWLGWLGWLGRDGGGGGALGSEGFIKKRWMSEYNWDTRNDHSMLMITVWIK
jgi:hypothetical protein